MGGNVVILFFFELLTLKVSLSVLGRTPDSRGPFMSNTPWDPPPHTQMG